MLRLILLVMLGLLPIVSCTQGVVGHDCNSIKLANGTDSAKHHFPSSFLDHLDVFCVDQSPPMRPVPCWLEWYGTSELYPGRMYAIKGLEHRCVVHEAYHAYSQTQGDECVDHATICGWNPITLELANADADN